MFAQLSCCAAMLFFGADPQAAASNDTARPQAAPAADELKLLVIERNIVDRTNAERARFGLVALEVDRELMESARAHCTWMTLNQTLQHTRQPVAENIAMGQQSSEEVVQCWMNSSGHRANLLNPGHRRIGVAAFRTEQGTIFWCQQFKP